jgi:hypothetical protein
MALVETRTLGVKGRVLIREIGAAHPVCPGWSLSVVSAAMRLGLESGLVGR